MNSYPPDLMMRIIEKLVLTGEAAKIGQKISVFKDLELENGVKFAIETADPIGYIINDSMYQLKLHIL